MKICRSLSATAVPVALGLACAVPSVAAAAIKVSFRVEGARTTLLEPATVKVPTSGSITRGGTPAGTCPADSAAGAFNVATHGRWGGHYSNGLGVEVTSILGTSAVYTKGSYWEFFVNDRVASAGVCDTRARPGEQFLFAQVPARGASEYPIVVTAPRKVVDGHPFTVRTFIYTGNGDATRPVTGVRFDLVRGGDETAKVLRRRSSRGITTFEPSGTGQISLAAVSAREIRSAPFTLNLARR